MDRWVIVELSHRGEKKDPPELEELLRQEIGDDVEIFVPAMTYTRNEETVTICLMEGYAFIAEGISTSRYFSLEESPYVQRVMARNESDGRFVQYVPDTEVKQLRRQLNRKAFRDLSIEDEVLITEGSHSELEGEIVDLRPEENMASVRIDGLKSISSIVELPYAFLEKT